MKDDKKKKNIPENPSPDPGQEQDPAANTGPIDQTTPPPSNGNHPTDTEPSSEEAPKSAPAQAPMVALSMEEYDNLQKELEKSRSQAASYFEGWQRERADFVNYKKRIDRDSAQVYQNSLVSVLKKYLVILDDLDRALKTRPTVGEGVAWSDGIELILRKLTNLLENEGVSRMETGNDVFDPNRHEAVTYEDSPAHQSGQIIEIIQPGYLLGDRVIRPAQVRVAK